MTRNPRTRNQARAERNAAKANTLKPRRNRHGKPQLRRHKLERDRRDSKDRKRIAAILNGMTPGNRADAERFSNHLRQQKRRLSYVVTRVQTLAHIDLATNGTPWSDLFNDPDRIATFMLERSEQVQQGTASQDAGAWRQFCRFVRDEDDLPRGMKRATATGRPKRLTRLRVMPEEHFTLLLDAAPDLMWQAVYHLLREVGWRIGELCSLNVGSFQPDGAGSADFVLPPEREARFFLKTGPRTCAGVRSVGVVKSWLELHPFASDPDAPLFVVKTNQHDNSEWLPLGPDRIYRQLRKDRDFAELPGYTPHDFRHTAATEKAKQENSWSPAEANNYFGWTPGSTMWTNVYVHLAEKDLKDRIRRDNGLDRLGNGTGQTKPCDFCAEPIKKAARKCKHCGEFQNMEDRRLIRSDDDLLPER